MMNYCTVCKREYRQNTGYQTGRCPVCGSMLIRLSDDALDEVRQEKNLKRE